MLERLREAQKSQDEITPNEPLEVDADEFVFELNGKPHKFYKRIPGEDISAFTKCGSVEEEGTKKPKTQGAFVGITDFTLVIVTWNANEFDSKGRRQNYKTCLH